LLDEAATTEHTALHLSKQVNELKGQVDASQRAVTVERLRWDGERQTNEELQLIIDKLASEIQQMQNSFTPHLS
jgi:hypothetical protein